MKFCTVTNELRIVRPGAAEMLFTWIFLYRTLLFGRGINLKQNDLITPDFRQPERHIPGSRDELLRPHLLGTTEIDGRLHHIVSFKQAWHLTTPYAFLCGHYTIMKCGVCGQPSAYATSFAHS